MKMRSKFDEQLNYYTNMLIKMGAICESMLEDIHQNFKNTLVDETLKEKEYDVFRLGRDIENLGMEMLIRQQPVARDLRLISSGFKIIYDYKRIATQVMDIREICQYVTTNKLFKELDILDISKIVKSQVSDSITAFVNLDENLSKQVVEKDDIVDNLFMMIKEEIVENMKKDNPTGEYLDILMIAKYYERIADHAVNIALSSYYTVTGENL